MAPIEEKYNVFNNFIKYYLNLSFPMKSTKCNNKKKTWLEIILWLKKKKIYKPKKNC